MVDLKSSFRTGDKVPINSGSPDLTVLVTNDRNTTVEWENEGNERASFSNVWLTAL